METMQEEIVNDGNKTSSDENMSFEERPTMCQSVRTKTIKPGMKTSQDKDKLEIETFRQNHCVASFDTRSQKVFKNDI